MHWIDWTLVLVPLGVLLWVAFKTNKYLRGVADFLSGNRMAGRYLLAVAKGEQGVGAVVFVATFEIISRSGFVLTWWGWIGIPLSLIIGISGWVIYRFRETRALTLAQFFEMRYSRRFRIFTGILGFVAGLLNFGVIPVIGARFLTIFLGLPDTINLLGWQVPSHIPLMALLLALALTLTLSGGLITLMVTNCLEGMFSQVMFLVIIGGLLYMFSWSEISTVLEAQPAGQSLLNPFDSMGLADFNIWYVLIGLWGILYRTLAWQNQSAYSTAAVTAHESRMGGILSNWKGMGNTAVITLLAVCAMTFLAHEDFAQQSLAAKAQIAGLETAQLQAQMSIPVAVEHMLPVGIKGALCIVLLMGVFGGDGTHLHSWGSLLIQDVVLPLRKKPLSPKAHIRLLRCAMVGVAVFAFIFGCLFTQTEYLAMWWMVTEALYVGGAGIAIIGGLYWKKGTTQGAWAGLLVGSGLITGGIVARQLMGNDFPLNGALIAFWGSITACVAYIVVSLLTCKKDYNMERMLHRGEYAVAMERKFETHSKKRVVWGKLIGIDDNFTRSDKVIAGGLFGWSMLWFIVLIIGSIWNAVSPWSIQVWSQFWYVVGIGIPVAFALITGVWFIWGGTRDMRLFFKRLNEQRIDAKDDGTVDDKEYH